MPAVGFGTTARRQRARCWLPRFPRSWRPLSAPVPAELVDRRERPAVRLAVPAIRTAVRPARWAQAEREPVGGADIRRTASPGSRGIAGQRRWRIGQRREHGRNSRRDCGDRRRRWQRRRLAVGAQGRAQAERGVAGAAGGPPIVDLFNGTDLSGFTVYKATSTANNAPGTALSAADAQTIFKPENGTIHVYGDLPDQSTQVHYLLQTVASYGKYNLWWDYKWGVKKFAPYTDLTKYPRDAGVLWHIHGDKTQVWPSSIEFQNKWGSTGDIFALYARCKSLGAAGDPTQFADAAAGGTEMTVDGSSGSGPAHARRQLRNARRWHRRVDGTGFGLEHLPAAGRRRRRHVCRQRARREPRAVRDGQDWQGRSRQDPSHGRPSRPKSITATSESRCFNELVETLCVGRVHRLRRLVGRLHARHQRPTARHGRGRANGKAPGDGRGRRVRRNRQHREVAARWAPEGPPPATRAAAAAAPPRVAPPRRAG